MGIRELLILLLIFAIVVVVLRGIFVAISGRKNKIKIALDKNIPEYDLDELELRELPSGGARQVERSLAQVMKSQGLHETASGQAKTPVKAPPRKSTLKPPRTNTFKNRDAVKNRDQQRSVSDTTATGSTTVASAAAVASTVPAENSAAATVASAERAERAEGTERIERTDMSEAAVMSETADMSEKDQTAHEQGDTASSVDLRVEDGSDSDIAQEEPVTAEPGIETETLADDWEDEAWLDDVSSTREISRSAAATTQPESSVLSEPVEDSFDEVIDEETTEEESEPLSESEDKQDYPEEGFDLDRAEPMFIDDDEDWDESEEESSEEEGSEEESHAQTMSAEDEEADSGNTDDEWLFESDDEEDNNVFLSDVSEPGAIDETVAEDQSEEPVQEAFADGEDQVEDDQGRGEQEGAEQETPFEALDFSQDESGADTEPDPLLNNESLERELVDEELVQETPLNPEQDERDLDNVLDELLEENTAPAVGAPSDSLEYSPDQDVDNSEQQEDRDVSAVYADGSSQAEDEGEEEESAEDDPLFDYDGETSWDEEAVDEFIDGELTGERTDGPADEQGSYENLAEAVADVDPGYPESGDVEQDDTELANGDELVEVAPEETPEEVAELTEDEDDVVPDFDDELEAEAEPQPDDSDAFAAVDPDDDLDVLFEDEDRQRRIEAIEEIEEKEGRGRRWMSWAGGALKRFGSKDKEDEKAQVDAQSFEQHTTEQGATEQDMTVQAPLSDEQAYQDDAYQAETYQDQAYQDEAYQDQAYQDEEDTVEYTQQEPIQDNAVEYADAGRYQEQQLSLDIESEQAAESDHDGHYDRRAAASGRSTSQYQQQSAFDDGFASDDPFAGEDAEESDDGNEPSEVLAINVLARQGRRFAGDELLQILLASGLRFGEMSIFHRHANGKNGPVLFSVANALNPGTFDLNEISEFTTPGVCFFMTLPNVASNNMLVYEQMLATARHVQQSLDAELKDDNRSVMTAQTMEHYRQRIRDFELQQLKNAHGRR